MSLYNKMATLGVPDTYLRQQANLQSLAETHAINVKQDDRDRLQVEAHIQIGAVDIGTALDSGTNVVRVPVSNGASAGDSILYNADQWATFPVTPIGGVVYSSTAWATTDTIDFCRLTSTRALATSAEKENGSVTIKSGANPIPNTEGLDYTLAIPAGVSAGHLFIDSTDTTATFSFQASKVASPGASDLFASSSLTDITLSAQREAHALTSLEGCPYLNITYTNSSGSDNTLTMTFHYVS